MNLISTATAHLKLSSDVFLLRAFLSFTSPSHDFINWSSWEAMKVCDVGV